MNLEIIRQNLAVMISGSEFEGKCFLAGGCVRDWRLGRESTDLDLTVEMKDGGIKLARFLATRLNDSPLRTIVCTSASAGTSLRIFNEFGTAKLTHETVEIEFTMTRKELYYPKSRHPRVSFGTLRDDVLRRDFTINALLMDIQSGDILDLCERGLPDLEHGVVRCVGDPLIVLAEDPLRILRAMRFAARLGFDIDPDTWKGIVANAKCVLHLSANRISSEIKKICAEADLPAFQRLLAQSWIIQALEVNPRKASLFNALMTSGSRADLS